MREGLLFTAAKLRSIKVAHFLLITLFFLTSSVFAQVDKEFWFSIPHATVNHGYTYPVVEGGKPFYLRVSSLDRPAHVVVSFPANKALTPLVVDLAANQNYSFDLTSLKSFLMLSGLGGIENKGILVQSSDFITAYFELASLPNPEIFSLKGKNALGTKFYTPFQTIFPNDTIHNTKNTRYGQQNGNDWIYFPADSAFSSIDIVATEDGTIVEITPTTDIMGCAKGKTIKVALSRGQVFSARALSQGLVGGVFNRQAANLSGSLVVSNNKVSIIVRDDSVLPTNIANTGSYEDYVGDQIVPVNVVGREYIVVKGALKKIVDEGKATERTLDESVYVVGVTNGTTVTVDGVTKTINAGQTLSFPISGKTSHVLATAGVYVFHLSGFKGEMSGAVLPSIDSCTGSDQVGFVRTYGKKFIQKEGSELFIMNLLVRKGGETGFLLDGKPLPTKLTFKPVLGMPDWLYAQDSLRESELSDDSHIISNSISYFHMSFINTTAHNWGDMNALQVVGANYGYFSSFNPVKTNVVIENNNSNKIKIENCKGIPFDINLFAQGGSKYTWSVEKYDSASAKWVQLPASTNYYFKANSYTKTDSIRGARPVIDRNLIPMGEYRYNCFIVSKAMCNANAIHTVLVTIAPCIKLTNLNDCVCETTPGSKTGVCYDITKLASKIINPKDTAGYYVRSWVVSEKAGSYILDNFNGITNVTYSGITRLTKGIDPLGVRKGSIGSLSASTDTVVKVFMGLSDGNTFTLKQGTKFRFDVAAQISGDYSVSLSVSMALRTKSGITLRLPAKVLTGIGSAQRPWQALAFDFAGNSDTVKYSEIQLIVADNKGVTKDIYFDSLVWVDRGEHFTSLANPKCVTIHDKEVIYAVVNNKDVTAIYADTAKVTYTVNSADLGCPVRDTIAPPLCAVSGSCVQKIDLTKYTDLVGGSMIANKVWYYDSTLRTKIPDPTSVTLCAGANGTAIAYLDVQDNCTKHIAKVTFPINKQADAKNGVAQLCSDKTVANQASGVTLDTYKSNVSKNGNVLWYSDKLLTKPILGTTPITILDKDVVYAKIYTTDPNCNQVKTLTFSITKTPDASFTLPDVCKNSPPVLLKSGMTGSCVVDGYLQTSIVGPCDITYIVQEGACKNSSTKTVNIFDNPSVTLIKPHDSVVYLATTSIDNVLITGAVKYSWSENVTGSTALLVDPTVMYPKTKEMNKTTVFNVVVENVNPSETAPSCKASLPVTVPVKQTALVVDFTVSDMCLGTKQDIVPNITGGNMPYKYSWEVTPNKISSAPEYTLIPDITGDYTVTLTVTDARLQQKKVVKELKVNQSPTISLKNKSTCQGVAGLYSVELTQISTSPYTYQWTDPNGVLITSTTSGDAQIKSSMPDGKYPVEVMITDAKRCTSVVKDSVVIFSKPTVTIDKKFVICAGQVKTLQANASGGTPSYIYEWSNLSGGSISPVPLTRKDVLSPEFNASQNDHYDLQLKVTDKNSCSGTDVFSLDVNSNPRIDKSTWKTSYCASVNNQVLTACLQEKAAGSPTYTHLWYVDNVNKQTETLSSEICSDYVFDVSKAKTTVVKYVLVDAKGCSDTLEQSIAINPAPPAPSITVKPSPVCQYDTASISVASISKTNTFTWSGTIVQYLSASSDAKAKERSFVASKDGSFDVIVTETNSFGCATSTAPFSIVVNKAPIVTVPDLDICKGKSKEIKPTVIPSVGIASYRWLLDTTQLSKTDIGNPQFVTTNTSNSLYKLKLTVVNGLGCKGSDDMLVNVHDNPKATILGSAAPFAYPNTEFPLEGEGSGGSPAYTYEWRDKANIVSPNNQDSITAVLVTEGKEFEFVVIDKYGCRDSARVFVNMPGVPKVVLVNPTAICLGDTAHLKALASGGLENAVFTYKWFKDGVEMPGRGTDTLMDNPKVTTIYKVEVSTGGVSASDTGLVTVKALPDFTVKDSPISVCLNSKKLIEVTPGDAYTYSWKDGSLVSEGATFTFEKTDFASVYDKLSVTALDKTTNCKLTKQVPVTVNPLPSINATVDNPSVCAGYTANLTVTANPLTETYSYSWTKNGSDVTTDKDRKFVSSRGVPFNTAITVDFSVLVTNTKTTCSASAPVTVTVKGRAEPLNFPSQACNMLAKSIAIKPGSVIKWGEGSLDVIDNSDPSSPKLNALTAGSKTVKYRVTDKDNDDCWLDTSATIKVDKSPIFQIDPVTVCDGKPAVFEIKNTHSSAATYVWTLDGSPKGSGSLATQKVDYTKSGIVTVEAKEGDCSWSDTALLTINNNPVVILGFLSSNIIAPPYGVKVDLKATVDANVVLPYKSTVWSESADIVSSTKATDWLFYATSTGSATSVTFTVTDDNKCIGSATRYINRPNKQEVELYYIYKDTNLVYENPLTIIKDSVKGFKKGTSEIEVLKTKLVCNKFKIGVGIKNSNGDLTYKWSLKKDGVLVPFNHTSPIYYGEINDITDASIYTYIVDVYSNDYPSLAPDHREIEINRVVFPRVALSVTPNLFNDEYYENTQLTITAVNIDKSNNILVPKDIVGLKPSWSTTANDTLYKASDFVAVADSLSPKDYSFTYTLTSTKVAGCAISTPLYLPIKPRIPFDFKVRNTCVGVEQKVVIKNAIDAGKYKWTFTKDDAVDTVQLSSIVYITALKRYEKVLARVEDTRDRQITNTVATTREFEIFPELKIKEIVGKQDVCVGETNEYKIIYTNDSINPSTKWTFTWKPEDTLQRGEWVDSLSFRNHQAHWLSVGTNKIKVVSTYAAGFLCTDADSIPVRIHDVPTPSFIHTPASNIYRDTEVKFTNLTFGPIDKRVIDTTNIAFYWDFVGDGVYTAERFEPNYSYDHWGIFDVHLMAEDKRWGCKRVVSDTLEVKRDTACVLIFPNTFMPEASQNKVFHASKEKGILDTDFSLRVYNRWGQLLWETHSRTDVWDGVYQGAVSKQDVYVFHCQATCENGEVKNVKGDVTLLR